jgi:coatomer subunit beta
MIKKLLLCYWEVVEKKSKDGHLLHEMILVCNAMKNNLTHANEYIRGSTLRFLCKIKEPEILESLIPSITSNLEHRHSYVRKNAVLTVFHIYEAHAELIPDAPELIETFLYNESNPSAKRNAFMMLFHCDLDRAVTFLNSVMQTVGTLGESFQLVVLELIRKVCRTNPAAKGEYIRCIFNLVNCPSHAVAFEGANTLVALSSAPTAVRAAIAAYCNLLQHESDHNTKLIILSKLLSLKKRHGKVLQEMLMDILRTLNSPNLDIKKKTLDLALQLLSPRNVDEVVQLLKKELIKTENNASNPGESNLSSGSGSAATSMKGVQEAYRKVLMESMHQCAVQFPEVVSTVVLLLINYLGDESVSAASDVASFVREIVHEYPALREGILTRLLDSFGDIRSAEVYRTCVWILGDYAVEPAILEMSLVTLKSNIGNLPLLSKAPAAAAEAEAAAAAARAQEKDVKGHLHDVNKAAAKKGPVVLADGTYASSSAAGSAPDSTRAAASSAPAFPPHQSHLRTLLLGGDYLLGSVVANAYAKLALRFAAVVGVRSPEANEELARALLFAVSLVKMGQSPLATKPIDPDNLQRISILIKVLLEPDTGLQVLGAQSQSAVRLPGESGLSSAAVFEAMLEDQRKKQPGKQDYSAAGRGATKAARGAKDKVEVVKQADDLIVIRQLKGTTRTTTHDHSACIQPIFLFCAAPVFSAFLLFSAAVMTKPIIFDELIAMTLFIHTLSSPFLPLFTFLLSFFFLLPDRKFILSIYLRCVNSVLTSLFVCAA